jgi:hypothetical protein
MTSRDRRRFKGIYPNTVAAAVVNALVPLNLGKPEVGEERLKAPADVKQALTEE